MNNLNNVPFLLKYYALICFINEKIEHELFININVENYIMNKKAILNSFLFFIS